MITPIELTMISWSIDCNKHPLSVCRPNLVDGDPVLPAFIKSGPNLHEYTSDYFTVLQDYLQRRSYCNCGCAQCEDNNLDAT
jgi:hypothetical protein